MKQSLFADWPGSTPAVESRPVMGAGVGGSATTEPTTEPRSDATDVTPPVAMPAPAIAVPTAVPARARGEASGGTRPPAYSTSMATRTSAAAEADVAARSHIAIATRSEPAAAPVPAERPDATVAEVRHRPSVARLETLPGELVEDDESGTREPQGRADRSAPQRPGVPVGEFDADLATRVDAVRVPVASISGIRTDPGVPATGAPDTVTFERGDPTLGPDATTAGGSHRHSSGARLRSGAALRRKRGLAGDVRYVATALFGVRRSSRELAVLETRQASLQTSRKRHLVTLGRAAVTADALEHPALARAREQMSEIEDERGQHTAQVQAADSELMRVRTDRNEAAAVHVRACAALDAELAELTRKLEPLEKEVAVATKRAGELRDSIGRLRGKIVETEASLVSIKGQKLDRAEVQSDIATMKADLVAVKRDEPELASRLDTLSPRIAALEARRAETKLQRAELEEAEARDKKRAEELLTAIGAKRVVVDRAAVDAEQLRDKILLALGEQLYVDRPDDLRYELAPVDAIDVELGVAGRRSMEIREILDSLDRWKLVRGVAVLLVTIAAVLGFGWWLYVALG